MNSPPGAAARLTKSRRGSRSNRAEARIVITGFLLLFCVLGGYFAVRPVRETIGTILGRQATQNLWIFTALFAILIVPVLRLAGGARAPRGADARHLWIHLDCVRVHGAGVRGPYAGSAWSRASSTS